MSMPVERGVRRKRTKMPVAKGGGDSTTIKYSTLGLSLSTQATSGTSAFQRPFIPGYGNFLSSFAGPSIVSFYSTGVFKPGTRVRWEPSVSFTTSGRWFVGFTDNPEVCALLAILYDTYASSPTPANYAVYADKVKALGSVISFPVWQETEINFPTRIRRKRFDCNSTVTLSQVDTLDRSMQQHMFCALEAGPGTATTLGGFHFHDVVDVEGVHSQVT